HLPHRPHQPRLPGGRGLPAGGGRLPRQAAGAGDPPGQGDRVRRTVPEDGAPARAGEAGGRAGAGGGGGARAGGGGGRARGQAARDRRAAEALAEADRRKDEFLAVLGHELRNPLAPIRNALEVLRLRGNDQATLEWLQGILERQVGHLTRLVDDLLEVSRIARGKVTLQRRRLDLAALVADTVEDHRTALEDAGLVVTLDRPAGPVWVEGDPTRLAQVVGNLLNNARKFTDAGGRVSARV